MIGSMFAGTEEAPGEVELFQGRTYKSYRGMGSLGAMAQTQGSSDRYFQDASDGAEKLVPEGIEGRVPYKGRLTGIVHQMTGGRRAAMGYAGCHNIDEMRTEHKFVRVTAAGAGESDVHDVQITKDAPNYPVGSRGFGVECIGDCTTVSRGGAGRSSLYDFDLLSQDLLAPTF